MAQNTGGYSAVNPNYGYGYGQNDGYGSYPAVQPAMPTSYVDTNAYTGYDSFNTGYDQPAATYQPTGSYGAIGEPVKAAGYDTGQFTSPPKEADWQNYGGYGGGTQQYGADNTYTTPGSDYSTQDVSQNVTPTSYGTSQGLSSDRGSAAPRGNQGRGAVSQGRGGFDRTDGYSRGGMRGRGRGQYGAGGSGQFGGDENSSGGQFDGGSWGRGGRGNRGARARGRGQFDGRNRGRGGSNRGRGFVGEESMGGGQFDRGGGQVRGGSRGRGQFVGGSRGRGDVGVDRGRGQPGGMSRGRGQSDRSRGRGYGGSTRGRGWVPDSSQSFGQDATRGRGQSWTRGNGQTSNRGRGQDGTSGRGQYGGVRGRGEQGNFTRGGAQPSRGRGRGDGGTSFLYGVKAPKPFKMSSADAQGFISYKNNLQEYAQKNHKPIPQYVTQKEDVGYSATVSFDGVSYSCQQSQRDKKDAEQGAAFEALKALGYIDANEMFSPKVAPEKAKKRPSGDGEISEPSAKVAKPEQAVPPQPSYKSKLNEAVMKMKLDLPTYSTIRTAGGFLSTVVWNGQVYQGVNVYGTKKIAEQHVAEIVFNQLDFKTGKPTAEGQVVLDQSNAVLSTSDSNTESFDAVSSPPKPPSAPKPKPMKNIVQEYCQKNGMQIPIYNTVKDTGMFIATVTVNGVEYVGTPHIMKKTAEQNAAKKVIEQLGLK